jgi:hypothetical protein
MEDDGDRANEEFQKKENRRQQKLLMKSKSVAENARGGVGDSMYVIKKIVSEMPPVVLQTAEDKHKTNPLNVRVDVNEISAR